MEERATEGVTWTLLTYAVSRLMLLATTVALARLLTPEDFGVVAVALLSIAFVLMVSDLGLGSTLVVRHDLDRDDQGTVLTMMLVMGGVCGAIMAALAPVVAAVLREPRLSAVLPPLSVTVAANSVSWFYEPILLKQLQFRGRFFAYLAQSTVFSVSAIMLAATGAGVWSLVVGHLLGTIALSVGLLRSSPYRVTPRFDRHVAADVFTTGRAFMVLGGLSFVRQNVDYVAVSRTLGATPLGFYSMAYRFSDLPSSAIADPVAKVTFPAFARMRAEGKDLEDVFLATLQLVALVTCPLAVILSASAEPFTLTFFGERWAPMIGLLTILGLWGALRPVQVTLGWFLNACDEASLAAKVTAATLLFLVPGAFVSADLAGARGVAWVVLVEAFATAIGYMVAIGRRVRVSLLAQARSLCPVLLVAPASWLVGRVAAEVTGDMAAPLALLASATSSTAAYLTLLRVFAPKVLRDGRTHITRLVVPKLRSLTTARRVGPRRDRSELTG